MTAPREAPPEPPEVAAEGTPVAPARRAAMPNLALRVLTALVGVPTLVGLAYLGGWYFGGLVLALALLCQQEVYRLLEQRGERPMKALGLVLGGLVGLRALLPSWWAWAVLGLVGLLACSPFLKRDPLASLGGTLLGIVYPTALFTVLIDLRLARGPQVGDQDAFYLVLAVFVLIWATDTMAYAVGRAIGRTPLAPSISPSKTWEGAIGGALGAVAAAVVLKLAVLDALAWPHVLVLALICGILSQLGDLAESKIKRSAGAKDSGRLLPGHGGLLDRFDAMLLAAPLVFLYLTYVAGVFYR